MQSTATLRMTRRLPAPTALFELLKPVTWFPPMWAFVCGVVSAGMPIGDRWLLVLAGVALAGPLVCGASQVVNDWFDRHVDAINEPQRPIPSGRVPGRWGLYFGRCWRFGSAIFWGPGYSVPPCSAWCWPGPTAHHRRG